jgi:glutathione S-transferase
MTSQLKPIKIYGQGSANPLKVRLVVEELGLPYEIISVPFANVKNPEYVAINPNGRLPSIQDPNTDITIWESGAIIEYLIERYDPDHSLSFAPGTPESYHAKQWLYFQVSGQGPYYGQASWFKKFHHELLPSALERYLGEMKRVSAVLDGYLAQQKEKYAGADGDGPWLVGNKMSYADISFLPWQIISPKVIEQKEYNDADFPNLKDWTDRMSAREKVKAVLAVSGRPE